VPAIEEGVRRWKEKVRNKSWTGLNGMEEGGNNGLTHMCKLDDIRGVQLLIIHKKLIDVYRRHW